MESNGNYSAKDIRRLAMKVEWYNPKDGKWTLGRHPPYDPEIKGDGKFVVYFRFPSQLTSERPRCQSTTKDSNLQANTNEWRHSTLLSQIHWKGRYGVQHRRKARSNPRRHRKDCHQQSTVGGVNHPTGCCRLYSGCSYVCLTRGDHNAMHVAGYTKFSPSQI